VNSYDKVNRRKAEQTHEEAHEDKPFDGLNLRTGKAELPADRPLFFRRRRVPVRQNQNAIRQSAVRQGDWKYLKTYNINVNDILGR
jgi:hypothetical protein